MQEWPSSPLVLLVQYQPVDSINKESYKAGYLGWDNIMCAHSSSSTLVEWIQHKKLGNVESTRNKNV